MRASVKRLALAASLSLLLLPFPGAAAETAMDIIMGQLARCTQTHGYDPDEAVSLGPHELGSGELAWRECVYAGIEEQIVPRTQTPSLYRTLIVEDRRMTKRVQAGELTRTARRERLQEWSRRITDQEETNRVTADKQYRELEEQMRRMRADMERLRTLNTLQMHGIGSGIARQLGR